jgi:hypothetical protein
LKRPGQRALDGRAAELGIALRGMRVADGQQAALVSPCAIACKPARIRIASKKARS